MTGGCSEGLDAFRFFFKHYDYLIHVPVHGDMVHIIINRESSSKARCTYIDEEGRKVLFLTNIIAFLLILLFLSTRGFQVNLTASFCGNQSIR